jgi:hypothetical protein
LAKFTSNSARYRCQQYTRQRASHPFDARGIRILATLPCSTPHRLGSPAWRQAHTRVDSSLIGPTAFHSLQGKFRASQNPSSWCTCSDKISWPGQVSCLRTLGRHARSSAKNGPVQQCPSRGPIPVGQDSSLIFPGHDVRVSTIVRKTRSQGRDANKDGCKDLSKMTTSLFPTHIALLGDICRKHWRKAQT